MSAIAFESQGPCAQTSGSPDETKSDQVDAPGDLGAEAKVAFEQLRVLSPSAACALIASLVGKRQLHIRDTHKGSFGRDALGRPYRLHSFEVRSTCDPRDVFMLDIEDQSHECIALEQFAKL